MPQWLVDSQVSDRAVRLFALLAVKYADKDNYAAASPTRRQLAEDLRTPTRDGRTSPVSRASVDRAISELERVGALVVEQRGARGVAQVANMYRLQRVRPPYAPVSRGASTGEQVPLRTGAARKDERGTRRVPPRPHYVSDSAGAAAPSREAQHEAPASRLGQIIELRPAAER